MRVDRANAEKAKRNLKAAEAKAARVKVKRTPGRPRVT
jgi:hypothetical protein